MRAAMPEGRPEFASDALAGFEWPSGLQTREIAGHLLSQEGRPLRLLLADDCSRSSGPGGPAMYYSGYSVA